MNIKKKVVFLTGTRADYGKMKSLMKVLDEDPMFEIYIFVCGMHLSKEFGSTYKEIQKDGYHNIYIAYGLTQTRDYSVNLGNTVTHFSGYVDNIQPDMIIVHGDRMDAMAGALVGALHNIMVGHIEGGELSGTVDESIRHAISKFAHVHFVCTEEAKTRLIQLGEEESRIYVIGSPDIDIMMSDALPTIDATRERYDIPFDEYGILMYHPVTTEYDRIGENIKEVVDAILESKRNYVVIYPNSDLGCEVILNEYKRFESNERIRIFPSIRFEFFLTLLKHAKFMIGNSSAGVREAGIYGVPAIDIGTRQKGRYTRSTSPNILPTTENCKNILLSIETISDYAIESHIYGDGNSTKRFYEMIKKDCFWDTEIQKHFVDFKM